MELSSGGVRTAAGDSFLAVSTAHHPAVGGDIHFGYAVRLSYWGKKPFESTPAPNAPPIHGVMAQLTSSAFKNADGLKRLTKLIHCKAKMLIAEVGQLGRLDEGSGCPHAPHRLRT